MTQTKSSDSSESSSPPLFVNAENVTLSNCDLEQVHLVNAIQPHGVLLILEEPHLRIVQASANCKDFLGIGTEFLIGKTLDILLSHEDILVLCDHLAKANLLNTHSHLISIKHSLHNKQPLHLFGNRINDLLLLEFEQVDPLPPIEILSVFSDIRESLKSLQCAESFQFFLDKLASEMRKLTGFDRVMIYRFAEDKSGEVVAEAKATDLEPYLGLHFPASDIPEPARRLFALSALRHLPNVDYVPVPLVSDPNILHPTRVDLSYSFLRSVSVMYSEYLRNMGVKASMVMPLFKQGKLWGLISCLHSSVRYLPYEQRIPAEFLAQLSSTLLTDRENIDQLGYHTKLHYSTQKLTSQLQNCVSITEALAFRDEALLSTLNADGAAIIVDGQLTLLGKTPTGKQIEKLAKWIAQRETSVFSSHQLATEFPDAQEYQQTASGLLAIRLGFTSKDQILWFRSEVSKTVNWAGDPHKPVEINLENCEVRLRPRTSFAIWKETVLGQSLPWLSTEIDYAHRLRQIIADILIEHARLLSKVNAELQRSNSELDSFAYAASHDLKEPLRGIHNFLELLELEEKEHLSELGEKRIKTVLSLSEHMSFLLDSLLQYSRIGKNELLLQAYSTRNMATQAIELIKQSHPDPNIEFILSPNLPIVLCDQMLVSSILQNLLINAIKYNEQTIKRVEIGCDTSLIPPVFYVRDNGIGIAPDNYAYIFQLFRRLHLRNQYGGGTGAGLTIAKRAIERLNGTIWVESELGKGSTFYFTLTPESSKNVEHCA